MILIPKCIFIRFSGRWRKSFYGWLYAFALILFNCQSSHSFAFSAGMTIWRSYLPTLRIDLIRDANILFSEKIPQCQSLMTIFHRQDTVSDVTTRQNVSTKVSHTVGCGTYNIIIFLNKQPRGRVQFQKKGAKILWIGTEALRNNLYYFLGAKDFAETLSLAEQCVLSTPATKQQLAILTHPKNWTTKREPWQTSLEICATSFHAR